MLMVLGSLLNAFILMYFNSTLSGSIMPISYMRKLRHRGHTLGK